MSEKTVDSIVVESAGGALKCQSRTLQPPSSSEVQLRVLASGVCLGDEVGMHHAAHYPITPGHEVVGEVVALGDSLQAQQSGMPDSSPWKFRFGQRVGLGWFSGCCKECYNCRRGMFTGCGMANATGLTRDGGWCEYVNAHASALVPWPSDIPVQQAPMMCAGLTVFNAIRNSRNCKPGNTVAIVGMGGLGSIAIPLVKAFGMLPIVVSGSESKRDKAFEMGAAAFLRRQDTNFVEQMTQFIDEPYGGYGNGPGGVDLVLTTSPDVETVHKIVSSGLAMEAEIIMLSEPSDLQLRVPVIPLLMKRATIKGWSAGCPRDVEDLLIFCRHHGIWNETEAISIHQVPEAFERIGKGTGRFVIEF